MLVGLFQLLQAKQGRARRNATISGRSEITGSHEPSSSDPSAEHFLALSERKDMTTRRQMLKATMAMLGSAGLLGSARRILAQPAMKDMIHTHDHAAPSSQRVSSARGGPGRVV